MDIVTIASLNLVLQVIILMVVVLGYFLKRKMKLFVHGCFMLVAVVLQFVSLYFVMAPSFLALSRFGFLERPSWLSFVSVFHGILGGITLAIAVCLVALWHLRSSTDSCFKRKWIMRYEFAAWVSTLALGIGLYLMLYVFSGFI